MRQLSHYVSTMLNVGHVSFQAAHAAALRPPIAPRQLCKRGMAHLQALTRSSHRIKNGINISGACLHRSVPSCPSGSVPPHWQQLAGCTSAAPQQLAHLRDFCTSPHRVVLKYRYGNTTQTWAHSHRIPASATAHLPRKEIRPLHTATHGQDDLHSENTHGKRTASATESLGNAASQFINGEDSEGSKERETEVSAIGQSSCTQRQLEGEANESNPADGETATATKGQKRPAENTEEEDEEADEERRAASAKSQRKQLYIRQKVGEYV